MSQETTARANVEETMARARVLFLVTGAHQLTMKDATLRPTGYWADELLTPYRAFVDAGYAVDFATPAAMPPVADPKSLNAGDKAALADIGNLAEPLALDDVEARDYHAVFVPGGHGPLEDLATDRLAGALLADALDGGKQVGAVCHGPAALLAARRADGTPTFAGYRVTAFTDEEEQRTGMASDMRFLLQDKLVELGTDFVAGPAFESHTETDRNLHTGQNPQSSAQIAAEMLKALGV